MRIPDGYAPLPGDGGGQDAAARFGDAHEGGLPSAEELFGRPPHREPGELQHAVRHHLGLADAPVRRSGTGLPDVSGLRRELGLW